MRIEVLSSPAEFAAVRAQWNRLAGAVSKPSPFQTNEWLLERWSGLGLDGHVLVGSEGAEFRAALPLAVGRAGHASRASSRGITPGSTSCSTARSPTPRRRP